MADNLPQEPKQKKKLLWLMRLLIYVVFAAAVTTLLFILTPGFFVDEIVADIVIFVIYSIIELRKKNNTAKYEGW